MESLEAITANSPVDAINAISAPLATIKYFAAQNEKGVQNLQAIMVKLINGVADYLNVGKNMNGTQVVETINLILIEKDFAHLKIEDFKVCFDGIKRGKYIDKNKLFDRFDGQIIFEALYTYCNERADIVESENMRKAHELREKERKETINPKMVEILKTAIKEIPENKKPKERVELKDPRLAKWFSEFEERFSKEGIDKHGRFVPYNGKNLSLSEFIDEKIKEQNNAV